MSDLCTRAAYQVVVEYLERKTCETKDRQVEDRVGDKVEARPGGNAWYSEQQHGGPARKLYADYAIRMSKDGIKAVYLMLDGVIVAQSRR